MFYGTLRFLLLQNNGSVCFHSEYPNWTVVIAFCAFVILLYAVVSVFHAAPFPNFIAEMVFMLRFVPSNCLIMSSVLIRGR